MEYARVTEILKPFTGYQHVPQDTLQRAAARGTAVHAFCSAIASGEWMPENMVPAEFRGYVDCFRAWMAANVRDVILVERRFTAEEPEGEEEEDSHFGYTGQIDLLIEHVDGRRIVVDLKTTSQPVSSHPIQVAAYSQLLKMHDMPVQAAALVYLNKDGSEARVHTFDNTRCDVKKKTMSLRRLVNMFHHALVLYKFFNKRKGKSGLKT